LKSCGRQKQQFKSPDLDRIIEVALSENPGLRKAYARLGEADAVAQVEGARLLPWLDADNTFRQVRYAKHGIVASYNPALGGAEKTSDTLNPLAFRYEFDFWGKNRAALEAALGQQMCQRILSRAALLDKVRHDIIRYRQALPSGSVAKQILQNAEDQKAASCAASVDSLCPTD
jgi:outer membrane protein TolC